MLDKYESFHPTKRSTETHFVSLTVVGKFFFLMLRSSFSKQDKCHENFFEMF